MKVQLPLLLSTTITFDNVIPQVQSPSGSFIGNTSISQLDQFLGIRYAQPPLGPLRFANPVKFSSFFDKCYDATAYGPGCTQAKEEYNGISEDCLTLNVVRPAGLAASASLPVMFWIHGGGNMNGQSILYNGTALVQHSITARYPIIYVGINYRLGGFGFMSSAEFVKDGICNLGLKDQHLALQWVHENIASFGGDQDKVTIFGHSAGAANCWSQLHYAYKNDEVGKYFRGAITESGAPGSPGFPLALDFYTGPVPYDEILAKTNCTGKGVACLRTVPHDILAPLLIHAKFIMYTIDDIWFTSSMASLVESLQFAPIPIIHGTTLNDGSIQLPSPFAFPNRTALIAKIAGHLKGNTTTATEIYNTYHNLSPAALGKGPFGDPTAPFDYWVALALYSDINMILGKKTWLNIASQKVDAWGYEFRQQPPLNLANLSFAFPGASKQYAERIGVYHGSELPYVFGQVTSEAGHTQGDVEVAIAMMDYWISFAYFLDPNPPFGSRTSITWPKYSPDSPDNLLILEDQAGFSIRTGTYLRPEVYPIWGAALKATGGDPPF